MSWGARPPPKHKNLPGGRPPPGSAPDYRLFQRPLAPISIVRFRNFLSQKSLEKARRLKSVEMDWIRCYQLRWTQYEQYQVGRDSRLACSGLNAKQFGFQRDECDDERKTLVHSINAFDNRYFKQTVSLYGWPSGHLTLTGSVGVHYHNDWSRVCTLCTVVLA